MSSHICPARLGWVLDNPLRKLAHNPKALFGGYLTRNMIIFDIGSGTGYFTRALAGMNGPGGKVIAVDLQQEMLDCLTAKARKAGLADRIVAVRATGDELGLAGAADFALLFWMLHETGDPRWILEQVYRHLKPGGHLFLAEPRGEVPAAFFREFMVLAASVGFHEIKRPYVWFSRAAVYERPV